MLDEKKEGKRNFRVDKIIRVILVKFADYLQLVIL